MKITISNALITGFSASVANVAVHIQALRESHPFLKSETQKEIESYAKHNNVSLEEARKHKSFSFPTESLISAIQSKVLKLGSVTKTEDGVEVEIKDDFLIEYVNLSNNLLIKTLKPVADLMGIFSDYQVHVDQFSERWDEKSDSVEQEILSSLQPHDPVVAASDWTVKEIEHYESSPIFLNDNLEDFILIKACKCINQNGVSLEVSRHPISKILESKVSLTETAKQVNLPPSLVNTIRAHYNLSPLTDTVAEEVKTDTLTAEPGNKATANTNTSAKAK